MTDPIYIAFNKPYGVLTAFTDEEGRETLKSYIDVPGVYSAGRLDMDSEGLLLLTDDGEVAHRLTDPRFNHPKTYLVQVEGVPTPDALVKLASGVEVKGQKMRRLQVLLIPEPKLPERSKPVTPHGATSWLRIVMREGKKRQIRHMTAAVGLPTLRILRIAIGPISINELQPGEWRYLTPAEVAALKQLFRESASRQTRESNLLKPRVPKKIEPLPRAGGKPAASRGNAPGSRGRSGGRRQQGR